MQLEFSLKGKEHKSHRIKGLKDLTNLRDKETPLVLQGDTPTQGN
jgi:hypothetical protein